MAYFIFGCISTFNRATSIYATFKGKIATKRISEDIDNLVKLDFEQVQQILSLLMVSIGPFVLCTCDGHKWVDMAWEVNAAHRDIEIKFMHPLCLSRSYTWPRRDIFWVPITNILLLLKTSSFTTRIGRQYYYTMTIKNISKI